MKKVVNEVAKQGQENAVLDFNFEGHDVRAIAIDGEPWFVGKDVAMALGYKDTTNAMKQHVDKEDKKGWQITTSSGKQRAILLMNQDYIR